MNIRDLLSVLGLTHGGENRKRLKDELLDLRSKSFWVNTVMDDNKKAESAVGIVDKVDVTSTDCYLTFSSYMYEQLGFENGDYYTPLLGTILALKQKYIMSLYRFLAAEAYKGSTSISIDELRRITECTNKFLAAMYAPLITSLNFVDPSSSMPPQTSSNMFVLTRT